MYLVDYIHDSRLPGVTTFSSRTLMFEAEFKLFWRWTEKIIWNNCDMMCFKLSTVSWELSNSISPYDDDDNWIYQTFYLVYDTCIVYLGKTVHSSSSNLYNCIYLMSLCSCQALDGKTPLHMTAINGRFTRAQTLINSGTLYQICYACLWVYVRSLVGGVRQRHWIIHLSLKLSLKL